jgi:hypothetical protein
MRTTLLALSRVAAGRIGLLILVLGLSAGGVAAQSSADDWWNPFKQPDKAPPRVKQQLPPVDRVDLQREPRTKTKASSGVVESSDLAPVMSSDTSGLPLDLWRGLDMAQLEQLLSALDLPPRSPALHQLWRRMLLLSASPPAGAQSPDHFLALRLEALYRSGLLAEMGEVFDGSGSASPLAKVLLARKDIGLGAREAGCGAVSKLAAPSSGLPGLLKGEAQLLFGYCAAVADDGATAGLAASMAREEGFKAEVALTVLDNLASGTKGRVTLPDRVSLIDYRFLELQGAVQEKHLLERAEPALLVALATAAGGDVRLQTAAAEAALRLNALPPDAVAAVYRRQSEASAAARPEHDKSADPVLRRAQLFRAIEATQNPQLKAQLLRALLEDARRVGIRWQTAAMLAPSLAGLFPSPDAAMLAEPAVEIALAAGEYEAARRWAETSASLQGWLALIELADSRPSGGRQSGLAQADALAARGRLGADVLHRLATVLDALDIDVPRGIWEAAGRIPQPTAGYLPATGVLAELGQAAQRKDCGTTVLLAMRAFGANAADGVNMLALGDAVRALKKAGLEPDARRLAVEALFAVWPRGASG